MRRFFGLLTLAVFMTVGCGEKPIDESGDASAPAGADDSATDADGKPFAVTPENTTIKFVGIHVGDKPDPRSGEFKQVTGTIMVDGDQVTAIDIDIDTTSVSTDIEKLTNHLKSPDFFDVNQFPTAKFESTSIDYDDSETATVTGNLTLHGETKEISFPATITASEDSVNLKSEFTIDRTEFGMTFGTDNVAPEVSMTVSVEG